MEADRRAAHPLSAVRQSHDTENVAVTECCFLNPYEAIKLVAPIVTSFAT